MLTCDCSANGRPVHVGFAGKCLDIGSKYTLFRTHYRYTRDRANSKKMKTLTKFVHFGIPSSSRHGPPYITGHVQKSGWRICKHDFILLPTCQRG